MFRRALLFLTLLFTNILVAQQGASTPCQDSLARLFRPESEPDGESNSGGNSLVADPPPGANANPAAAEPPISTTRLRGVRIATHLRTRAEALRSPSEDDPSGRGDFIVHRSFGVVEVMNRVPAATPGRVTLTLRKIGTPGNGFNVEESETECFALYGTTAGRAVTTERMHRYFEKLFLTPDIVSIGFGMRAVIADAGVGSAMRVPASVPNRNANLRRARVARTSLLRNISTSELSDDALIQAYRTELIDIRFLFSQGRRANQPRNQSFDTMPPEVLADCRTFLRDLSIAENVDSVRQGMIYAAPSENIARFAASSDLMDFYMGTRIFGAAHDVTAMLYYDSWNAGVSAVGGTSRQTDFTFFNYAAQKDRDGNSASAVWTRDLLEFKDSASPNYLNAAFVTRFRGEVEARGAEILAALNPLIPANAAGLREVVFVAMPPSAARAVGSPASVLSAPVSDFLSRNGYRVTTAPDILAMARTQRPEEQRFLDFAERLIHASNVLRQPAATTNQTEGATVIIFDDVVTTGASMHAAARLLLTSGGANRIISLSAFRVSRD